MSKYICIDNYSELLSIQKQFPELEKEPLILLSGNFNLEQKESFAQRGYCYFDELIDDVKATEMSVTIHKILWGWFKDEKDKDLSLLDGLSLGMTFSGSMEILINSILKYEVGLEKILKMGDTIYYATNTDEVFIETIRFLKAKIGIELNPVSNLSRHKVVLFGRDNLKLDPGGRVRDLAPYFKTKLKFTVIYYLLSIIRLFRPKSTREQRILLFTAGKLDEYVKEKKTQVAGPLWMLPMVSLKELAQIALGRCSADSIYCWKRGNGRKDKRLGTIIRELEKNISFRIKEVSSEALISLARRNIFRYFPAAMSLYKNMIDELKYLSPCLVIICADGIETHYLLAQAARFLKIQTALLPHGIDDWGYEEARNGSGRMIDWLFAFGRKHVMDEQARKVSRDRIIITSHPYFSKFLPQRQRENLQYKKALLLPPDYIDISPASKQNYFYHFLREITALLQEIGIDEMGIKVRGEHLYQMHGIVDVRLVIGDVDLRLYAGYTNFCEVSNNFDLIIGGVSTALIEAGLLGKDYYVYYNKNDYLIPSMSRSIEKIVYVSHTIDELMDNIRNRRIYRENCSVEDMIDLKGVTTRNELFDKFELAVAETIKAGGK